MPSTPRRARGTAAGFASRTAPPTRPVLCDSDERASARVEPGSGHRCVRLRRRPTRPEPARRGTPRPLPGADPGQARRRPVDRRGRGDRGIRGRTARRGHGGRGRRRLPGALDRAGRRSGPERSARRPKLRRGAAARPASGGSSTSADWAATTTRSRACTCRAATTSGGSWPAPASTSIELRAGVIIGSGSASFEMLRYLVEVLPVMVTPEWVSTSASPSPSPMSSNCSGRGGRPGRSPVRVSSRSGGPTS